MKRKQMDFTMKYIKLKTIKQCIKLVEVELPALFGFS